MEIQSRSRQVDIGVSDVSLIIFQSFDDVRLFARGDTIDRHIWKTWEQGDDDLTAAEKASNAEKRAIARGNDKSARTELARHIKKDRRISRQMNQKILERVKQRHGGVIKGNSWIGSTGNSPAKRLAKLLRIGR